MYKVQNLISVVSLIYTEGVPLKFSLNYLKSQDTESLNYKIIRHLFWNHVFSASVSTQSTICHYSILLLVGFTINERTVIVVHSNQWKYSYIKVEQLWWKRLHLRRITLSRVFWIWVSNGDVFCMALFFNFIRKSAKTLWNGKCKLNIF